MVAGRRQCVVEFKIGLSFRGQRTTFTDCKCGDCGWGGCHLDRWQSIPRATFGEEKEIANNSHLTPHAGNSITVPACRTDTVCYISVIQRRSAAF